MYSKRARTCRRVSFLWIEIEVNLLCIIHYFFLPTKDAKTVNIATWNVRQGFGISVFQTTTLPFHLAKVFTYSVLRVTTGVVEDEGQDFIVIRELVQTLHKQANLRKTPVSME